jgi:hypothetical protein
MDEWQDALEHAMEAGRDTKVLLRPAGGGDVAAL